MSLPTFQRAREKRRTREATMKPSTHLTIRYEVVRMDDLIRHFMQGFDRRPEGQPELKAWYFDATKAKIVLELYVPTKEVARG